MHGMNIIFFTMFNLTKNIEFSLKLKVSEELFWILISSLQLLRDLQESDLFFGPWRCLEQYKIKVKFALEQTVKA